LNTSRQLSERIGSKGFMGLWEPNDREGRSLDKKFKLYAAHQDFTDASGKKILLTYKDTVKELASRKDWNGHDGGDFENDAALYEALKDGSGIGKWFIPPRELVNGRDVDGKVVRAENNLYALRETGDFKGTFTTKHTGSTHADWFWSCTETRDHPDFVFLVRFSGGEDDWEHKGGFRLRCRPCRVEAVVHLTLPVFPPQTA